MALAGIGWLLGAPAECGDWTRFRGPNGSGIADVEGLPEKLAAGSALWSAPIPFGQSSPIVVGSKVLLTALADEGLVTLAVDGRSGKELWRRSVPRRRIDRVAHQSGPAVATPVSDGSAVFAFFPEFGLVAYGLDGRERWRLEMAAFESFYGMAGSPVLEAGVLVLVCDQSRKPFIVGVDAATGQELWRKPREVRAESWTTPIVHRPGTEQASILVFGTSFLDAYAPRTGERLWRLPGFGFTPVASPVLDGERVFTVVSDQAEEPLPSVDALFEPDKDRDGRLTEAEFAGSPFASVFPWLDMDGDGAVSRDEYATQLAGLKSTDYGLVAVELGKGAAEIVWRQQKTLPYIATPIVYRGVLFLIKDGGILTSYDPATGSVLKRGRIEGASGGFSPSPVAAGGKLYLASSSGAIAVVAARGDWQTLSLGELDEEVHATPALGDGRLYLRTRSRLYAFGPAN
jgi:outer membrane protein assembly factor BamB